MSVNAANRRIDSQCGDDLLKLRTMQLNQSRAGTKSRGKLRESSTPKKRGESGLSSVTFPIDPKQSLDPEWREPKSVIVIQSHEQREALSGFARICPRYSLPATLQRYPSWAEP